MGTPLELCFCYILAKRIQTNQIHQSKTNKAFEPLYHDNFETMICIKQKFDKRQFGSPNTLFPRPAIQAMIQEKSAGNAVWPAQELRNKEDPGPMSENRYQQDLASGIWFIEEGQGPPLLLLHGNGADAALYLPLLELLAPHFRVLMPDLPGFGRSPARERWSMAGYMGELERFINSRIRAPYVLMGHSLGGYLAYQLLIRRRTQPVTRSIWMEAAIFKIDWRVARILPGYGFVHRFKSHSRERIEARLRDWCLDYDNMDIAFREGFVASFFRSDRQVQGMMMSAAPALLPYRFHQLELPVLCIRGQKEQFLSRQTDWFAPRLPQGQRVVIPDSGHFLLFENDAGLQHEILRFLAPTAACLAQDA